MDGVTVGVGSCLGSVAAGVCRVESGVFDFISFFSSSFTWSGGFSGIISLDGVVTVTLVVFELFFGEFKTEFSCDTFTGGLLAFSLLVKSTGAVRSELSDGLEPLLIAVGVAVTNIDPLLAFCSFNS